jgi:hypothetical protein
MKHFYQETDATEIENQHNQQIKHQIAGQPDVWALTQNHYYLSKEGTCHGKF